MLLGRHTYESFAPVWSARSGDPLSDRMNALPRYVVSTTLTDPQWNNTVVVGRDPLEAVRALKQQPGGDIVHYGFGRLAHALLAAGLLDDLRLWLHPFFVGSGRSEDLLHRAGSSGRFELTGTTELPSGIIVLDYRVLPR